MNPRLVESLRRQLGLKPSVLAELLMVSPTALPWRVATVERDRCTLLGVDDMGALIERSARVDSATLAVGDWVTLADETDDPAWIRHVLPRSTFLERGSAHHDGETQIIAANLDTAFIVAAFAETEKLERRALRPRRLDRFIAAVKGGGVVPVVILNKVDITERTDDELAALQRDLSTRLGGVGVVTASATERQGLDALGPWLGPGETVAFLGASGVGKSTLVNALAGRPSQEVASVRSRDAKGRHTTTRRELVRLPGGALLIDTPGVRQFAVVGADIAGFEDIDQLADDCRFANCAHDAEPGCAVRQAVERGDLPADRLSSYRDLRRDADRHRVKHDAYARHLERAEQRRFGRLVKRTIAEKKSR